MLSRRSFLARTAAAAAAGASTRFTRAEAPTVEVRTAEGVLRGSVEAGLQVFRGVPFAQPPVGRLRFRPPEPPLPFPGVRPALQFAAAAPQPDQPNLPQSEDCLYLNVWAPAQPTREPAPVFVWIHGGGFTGGHSFEPLWDGTHFANSGVLCITIAYRLGALGFLDVSPLLGPSYAGSADNAMRDVIAALTWVQRNIHSFGGDPRRVTVGGESAGAKLTDMLAGVPSARPLFHGMISESGGAERIWPAARGEEVGTGFGRTWQASGHTLPDLLTAAPAALVEAQTSFTKNWPVHFPLRAEYAAGLVPGSPLASIRAGSTRGKRLLLGTNLDESALFLGPHPTAPVAAKDLGNLSLAQFDAVAQRYAALYPDMPADGREIRSVTAEEYWVPSLRVADAHLAGGGGDTYVYRLDFPGTGRFAGLAFHSYDLRFVWDFFEPGQHPSPAARTLATQMHAAWVAFLHGGAPIADGLPAWPRCSTSPAASP